VNGLNCTVVGWAHAVSGLIGVCLHERPFVEGKWWYTIQTIGFGTLFSDELKNLALNGSKCLSSKNGSFTLYFVSNGEWDSPRISMGVMTSKPQINCILSGKQLGRYRDAMGRHKSISGVLDGHPRRKLVQFSEYLLVFAWFLRLISPSILGWFRME